MTEGRQQRRKRLTTEQKWQVFLEASRKNTSDAEVCRRWGITPYQLRAIGERIKLGGMEARPAVRDGRARTRRRPSSKQTWSAPTLPCASWPSRTPCCGESEWGLIGPIRGKRLEAEIKLQICRAIEAAKRGGMSIEKACGIIQLDPRRLRRWASRGGGARTPTPGTLLSEPAAASQRPVPAADRLSGLCEDHLVDTPPVAKVAPHRLTDDERAEIVRVAGEEAYAHLRHRKLTHQLSRDGRVHCSASSLLRVLRAEGLVPVYVQRSRTKRPRPEVDERS